MKNLKISTFGVLTIIGLLLASCSKDEKFESASLDRELLSINAQVDYGNELDFNLSLDVANNNNAYENKNGNEQKSPQNCPSITVDNSNPGEFPKTFTIDYGANCISNGIVRSGKLTVTFSDYFANNGSVMTIVRGNDYYINGRKLEGTITYTNESPNAIIPKWTRTVTNGKITALTGVTYTFSGTRVVIQTAGVGTTTLGDNTYEILSGSHTITNENGDAITLNINSKLIKKYACAYISQGKLRIQGNYLNGILDYGDNECDNEAIYEHSDGNTYTVYL